VKILIINGPTTGKVAINAATPANACVNTPKTTVPKTTILVSISYVRAIRIINVTITKIEICFPWDLKKDLILIL
jgi:heme-binding NEAT domain protein